MEALAATIEGQVGMAVTDPAEPVDFDAFFGEAYPALARLARALTGSGAEAEDLAQEALSRAYQRWGVVGSMESPIGWCRRVLLNLVFSRTRRLRREAGAVLRLRSRSSAERAADAMALSDGATEFWAAVRSLPPRQSQVVALRYGADLDAAEIGSTLGCDAATVRSHLHSARRALAARLDELEDETGTEDDDDR